MFLRPAVRAEAKTQMRLVNEQTPYRSKLSPHRNAISRLQETRKELKLLHSPIRPPESTFLCLSQEKKNHLPRAF